MDGEDHRDQPRNTEVIIALSDSADGVSRGSIVSFWQNFQLDFLV